MMDSKELTDRVRRLEVLLKELLSLYASNLSMEVINNIDESYYMQKVVELDFMLKQLEEMERRILVLKCRLSDHCNDVFERWSKDATWLNTKLAE